MEQIYIDTAKILKAISDPKRLKIVDMLSCHAQCAFHSRLDQMKPAFGGCFKKLPR